MTLPAARRYTREFLTAMALYVAVLMASAFALRGIEAPWARAALALLPVLPIGLAARAMLRFVRDSDELQRRIQLEALALATLVLTLGAFALGMLALAGVVRLDAGLSLILVLPAYSLLFGLFAAITTRRYR